MNFWRGGVQKIKMIVTVLEAKVAAKKSRKLVDEFKKIKVNPYPGITQTYLLRDKINKDVWRMMAFWKTKKDFEDVRIREIPIGVKVFESVDAQPMMALYEVEEYSK